MDIFSCTVLLLLSVCMHTSATDTKGQHFVVTIPPVYQLSSYDWQCMIYIASNDEGQVIVQKHDGNTETLIGNYSVNAGANVLEVSLDGGSVHQTATGKQKKLIEISANIDVAVYVVYKHTEASLASFTALPTKMASTEYRISSYQPLVGEYNYLIVTSIEDDTNVNIYDFDQTNSTETLASLESYTLSMSGDSTGARVTSDKPVNVVVGSTCSHVPVSVYACDQLLDSPIPIRFWGQTFIIPPIYPRTGSIIRILSQTKDTTVSVQYIYGSTSSQNISFSGMYELQLGSTVTVATTDKPVTIAQYGVSQLFDNYNGDPFMMSVPADKHFSNNYVFSYPVSDKGLTTKIAVVIRVEHSNGLELNGQNLTAPINTLILSAPAPFDNYRVIISDISIGENYLRHPSNNVTFSALLYGLKTDEAVGYILGYNFDIDECTDGIDDCDENSKCTNTERSFTCTCNEGYTGSGKICTKIDECESNPCENNGTCNDHINFYNCSCQPGFKGEDCGIEIDECESNPCENDGTCNNYINFYNCSCQPGFEGHDCDIDTDECDSSPCKNDGTCSDDVNFYNCTCQPGYEGVNCEIDIFSEYLGIGISVSVVILLVCTLIFILCVWILRKRRQMSKVKERMEYMNRVQRNGTRNHLNQDGDVEFWRKSKISKKPQVPEWNTNENQWQGRYRIWRSLVPSYTDPRNFGNAWRQDMQQHQGHSRRFQH